MEYLGNFANLLLIMVPAMCTDDGSPFGDHNVCKTKGLSYASFSMAVSLIEVFISSQMSKNDFKDYLGILYTNGQVGS